ncbi:PTS sugar transporter subunit IIB, partial [Escherichia coli]|uniref:PTS sugar transporter subunit IIB n=1 Tax=Escherichia coli TaxID=562 RepID=UPI003CF845A0
MTSPNILLTRIDNRLVHGQVGVTWTSTIGANLLVVVDDVVANDDIQQKLMGITAETYGFGGNDSNLLIVFYVQIMPDDFVMQLHR